MATALSGKAALVTGGSRGIGAAIAKRLARDGAAVAITYTKGKEPADAVVREIVAAGGLAIAIQADAADATAVQRAVDEAATKFGRLDVLVNNAGIAPDGAFDEMSLETFDRLIGVNIKGVMVATQSASKRMTAGGRVIMIGSCLGERVPFGGVTAYSMTKAPVAGLIRGMAREYGPRGITVNNVQPGPIDTEMNPAEGPNAAGARGLTALGRYGHVDDIASMVAYLAGPESQYVTGANILVDGGANA